MKTTIVIFKKQMADTLKNKEILIQFIMFPIITIIMEKVIVMEGMPENFFAKMFSAMYMGMAPLIATAAIIAEEKEKNTLRVLMMSDVRPVQYLLGVGSYVWLLCMIGAAVIALSTGFQGKQLLIYMCAMGFGNMVSIIVGAAIGMFARNQMMATSVVMPVMLVLSFLPMLAMFNKKLEIAANFFYTRQIQMFMNGPEYDMIESRGILIVLCNMIVALVLFLAAYKKNGLE